MQGCEPARREPLRSGQQTVEFALLIGIVAMAAVGMQSVAQRAAKAGLWNIATLTLGDPGPVDVNNSALVSLDVAVSETRTQLGDGNFHRTETSSLSSAGQSVTHDEFTRIVPDLDLDDLDEATSSVSDALRGAMH